MQVLWEDRIANLHLGAKVKLGQHLLFLTEFCQDVNLLSEIS